MKGIHWVTLFLRQFNSPIVRLLLLAAILSFSFVEWIDGMAVLVVLVINALIGFLMGYPARNSMKSEITSRSYQALCQSDSKRKAGRSPGRSVVPGDILFVEAGDVVAADVRICNQSQLQVDESALTGESVPVEKRMNRICRPATA